ncbi:MAG: LacI family DNA-binding transcriptional regulator [Chthonomonadales bacterium]|nr:LacI family DNA-binding transcriptional regulator [Chthonomonadales bacterium]
MRRTTIRDIAAAVGASPATVSKVLTGRGDSLISDTMRQRIRESARELGYSPNLAARALVTGRTYCIALWSETLADYHAAVANALLDVLRPSRYEMVITDVVKHPDWYAYFQRNAPWPVDGIIALDSPQSVEAYLATSAGRNTPVVSIGAYYWEHTDHIGVDLGAGVRQAAHHLAEQGCRRIAHLTCDHGMRPGEPRRLAYEEAMVDLGLEPRLLVTGQSSREDARLTVRDLVGSGQLPDALLCFNDETAIGAYRGLRDLGVRIPDDVALIGCDGIQDTAYFDQPITTIVQPVNELCRSAWQCLQTRLDEPDAPRQSRMLKADLMIRESSLRIGRPVEAAANPITKAARTGEEPRPDHALPQEA